MPAEIAPRLRGSLVALVTPFGEDGAVDEAALGALVDWHVAEGTAGLVPVGTTGESPTLSHEEHERVVEVVVERAAGRVPVVAGAGSNNTAEGVRLIRHAARVGADAALVVTPYYNRPTQGGLVAHFTALAEAADLPIVIYNIPARSAVDMAPETMAELARLPGIVGVKDATGDVVRVSRQRALCGEGFVQLSGEDASALGFNAHGGVGCISVTANVAPRLCAAFQAADAAGRPRGGPGAPGPADAAARGAVPGAGPRGRQVRAVGDGPLPRRGAPAARAGGRGHAAGHQGRGAGAGAGLSRRDQSGGTTRRTSVARAGMRRRRPAARET